jgi:hypothetical protein
MNKKLFALLLIVGLLALGAFGCGDTPAEEAPEETPEETPENGEVVDGTPRLGLGIVPSIARSRDASDDLPAQAQADVTMAAVLFDEEGRVVSVTIDNAQNRVLFDEEMQLETDVSAPGTTKVELGDDYGMLRVSEIEMEWYEQIAAFEEWMIGQTVDEIKSLQVKVVDDAHQNVPDIPELTTSVTITVESYIAAVEHAYENSVEAEGAATAGLGSEIALNRSRGLDADNDIMPMAQFDNTMAAVAFDADGVIVAAIIDNAQIRVNYDEEGQLTTDRTEVPLTKAQLGDDYGMRRVSEIDMEWYEQIAAFEEWMVGKTMDEVLGLPVKVVDDAHQNVPDVPELTTSVTITVESYLAAVAEAYANAR